ncbi:uncharacterized protein CLUP02_05342 [Colletotrichum lupini]|uniref:Uncharacterized protein n=1 Tax=Colletotrichum lupini TaxID=145971 RepID=A0A9Q8SNU3_9PEZI|nr:uncharacterized protein CLUP02_05342 [Colletotrichum lupini]UQC79862.1 hypothetical protein CLUP02_05342 [Colletotrichum lupini]
MPSGVLGDLCGCPQRGGNGKRNWGDLIGERGRWRCFVSVPIFDGSESAQRPSFAGVWLAPEIATTRTSTNYLDRMHRVGFVEEGDTRL